MISGGGGFLQLRLDGEGPLGDLPHHLARDVTDGTKIRLDGLQAFQGGAITQEDGLPDRGFHGHLRVRLGAANHDQHRCDVGQQLPVAVDRQFPGGGPGGAVDG